MSDKKRTMLPGRVQAALEYLDYCHWALHTCDISTPARGLSAAEVGVQKAALEVLRSYFQCEMDFGDAPPTPPRHDGDEQGNGSLEPVNA